MYTKWFLIVTWLTITPLIAYENSWGNDLDDGIAIDDNVSGYDSIKMNENTKFISQKVQARASAGAKKIKDEMGVSGHDSVNEGSGGDGGGVNVGGVNIGAGAKHKGDIYIVIKDSDINATNIKK